jgi:hypothetical protein
MAHAEPTNAGYETRDIRPRGIVLLGAALAAVAIAVHVLLWWLFGRLESRAQRNDPPVSPLARSAEPAPGPQLELKLDYRQFERGDAAQLESYGWIDREQRIVHIPIERAMQLLVERGLPEPTGPTTSDQPTSASEAKP